jgi:magnesium transporter
MTIRVVCFDPQSGDMQRGGLELLAAWQSRRDQKAGVTVWVDLAGIPPEEERALMCERLGLHPNAVVDAQRQRHPPKVEQFAGYLFVLLRGLDPDSSRSDLRTIQLAMFVGEDFLVTRHSGPSASVEGAWREIADDPPEGADTLRLALRITRLMTDRYLALLFDLESRLDEIEDEMLARPEDSLLTELSDYKRELTRLRRNFTYHNQAFASARGLLHERLQAHGLVHDFNDVAEQIDRVGSLADLYYDLANDLLQTYVSLASHRLNGIMKVLTIITAIFVPLSFLAGLYGMNFEYMPELGQRYGYFLLLGLMALIAVVLLFVFRRKEWL